MCQGIPKTSASLLSLESRHLELLLQHLRLMASKHEGRVQVQLSVCKCGSSRRLTTWNLHACSDQTLHCNDGIFPVSISLRNLYFFKVLYLANTQMVTCCLCELSLGLGKFCVKNRVFWYNAIYRQVWLSYECVWESYNITITNLVPNFQ